MDSDTPYFPETLPTPLIGRKRKVDPRGQNIVMESRRMRSRRDNEAPLATLEVSWNFTQDEYDIFRTFFIEELVHGESTFVLITLEQAPDPSMVRQFTREVAFLDGQYTFDTSDNLVTVNATLEVDAEEFEEITNPFYVDPNPPDPDDPLDQDYETPCRDIVILEWAYQPGDIVQTSRGANGPWYDYIQVVPTASELITGRKIIKINNSFGGHRWFKVIRSSGRKTVLVHPQASVVAPPEFTVSNLTVLENSVLTYVNPGAAADLLIAKPYSWIENDLVQPFDFYIEPSGRFAYLQYLSPLLNLNTILTIDSEEGDTRWTRTGGDPEADTPVPTFEGLANNAYVKGDNFCGAIRARCFSGECRSPMTLLVIDKLYNIDAQTRTQVEKTGTGGFCYLPSVDGGNVGNGSCADFGGPTGFLDYLEDYACSHTGDSFSNEKWVSYADVQDATNVHKFSQSYLAYVADVNVLNYVGLAISRSGEWNVRPVLYEYSCPQFSVNGAEGQLWFKFADDESGEEDPPEGGISGPGGSVARLARVVDTLVGQFYTYPCGDGPQVKILHYNILTSMFNDEDTFFPPTDVPDYGDDPEPPPQPPAIDEYYDFMDDYVDGDATLQVMNGGAGWNGAWVFNQIVSVLGYDLMDGYNDGVVVIDPDAFDYVALEGGESWAEAWVFAITPIYYEDFEGYVDQVIGYDTLVTLNLGDGWALVFDDGDSTVQEGWLFANNLIGEEMWETYSDQVVNGSTVLDDDTGFGWTEDPWVFAGY